MFEIHKPRTNVAKEVRAMIKALVDSPPDYLAVSDIEFKPTMRSNCNFEAKKLGVKVGVKSVDGKLAIYLKQTHQLGEEVSDE